MLLPLIFIDSTVVVFFISNKNIIKKSYRLSDEIETNFLEVKSNLEVKI